MKKQDRYAELFFCERRQRRANEGRAEQRLGGGRTVMHHPGQADSFFLSVLVVTIVCRCLPHTGAVCSLLTQMSPASFIWASVLYPTQCVPASRFSLPPS